MKASATPDLQAPRPRQGESHDDWMSRCMGDEEQMSSFPDPEQRAAVCENLYRDARTMRASGVTPTIQAFRITGGEALEIQAANGDGQRPTFRGTVYTGGPLMLGNFMMPVIVDLESTSVIRAQNPVLRDHDDGRILGHTTGVEITPRRIRAEGVFSNESPDVEEVIRLGRNQFPWQMSMGADAERFDRVEPGDRVTVNGRSFQGPLLVARGTVIREVSFVALGADGNTSANVAAQREGSAMSFEQWLQAKSIDPNTLSDAVRAALHASWKVEMGQGGTAASGAGTAAASSQAGQQGGGGATGTGVSAGRQRTQADIDREKAFNETRQKLQWRQEIDALFVQAVRDNPDMLDELERMSEAAVQGEWSHQQCELEILRATRPRPQIVSSFQGRHGGHPSSVLPDDSIVEAAVCMAAGLPNADKLFPGPTLEASRRYWRNGLGLEELILTFARRNGFTGYSIKHSLDGALRAAFRPLIEATGWGPSTGGGIGGILSNVANKFVRVAFEAVDQAWRQIAATRNVNDFKEISTYSLTGDFTYKKLPPSGEIKHAQIGSETYSNKVDTFARMLGIDRRDLINDDLGALSGVGRRLGRGGALALNDDFWTTFLNNSAFFTAGRNNLLTGAGSALSITALDAANAAFINQTDPDGKPLGIMPSILLVPPALWGLGTQLMSSTMLNQDPANNTAAGSTNIWAGMFRVVTSPYMQNTTFTGNSATKWYLLANPADMPVIEVAFLRGAQTPTVESMEADFDMLGISMRGFFDFGSRLQEFRGGVASAGS